MFHISSLPPVQSQPLHDVNMVISTNKEYLPFLIGLNGGGAAMTSSRINYLTYVSSIQFIQTLFKSDGPAIRQSQMKRVLRYTACKAL